MHDPPGAISRRIYFLPHIVMPRAKGHPVRRGRAILTAVTVYWIIRSGDIEGAAGVECHADRQAQPISDPDRRGRFAANN
jgi:hypothetical protein